MPTSYIIFAWPGALADVTAAVDVSLSLSVLGHLAVRY